MKKIINEPNNVVTEMLQGFVKANPQLVYFDGAEVVAKKEKENKVGLVSGGGSGHEPAHAGYVGKGMLDAAVAGNVFASPSPDRVLKGIQEANTGKGVLLIIKNYSGDIMNFDMAKELAEMEDIRVESVVVKDDVAVEDSTHSTGRRGIAGTVFVHKIAGAKAVEDAELDEVKRVAEKTIANVRSMGMAMAPCVLPGVGKPGFALDENEIEIGMGIHGEPGVERTNIKTAEELANILCGKILEDFDFANSEVALMINGLGATPLMELFILNNEVQKVLSEKNISVYKSFVGNYMTSLEMAGCSVTLLKLDDELKKLLDVPCNTPALKVW
ncbi:dihydroxyacetone kinase subunit DhaK [Maledivibacter halophilus]|uniref:Dihydroxyacetone kinase DhaK subunit n=1 Tax=Maledivibacter halophilus TaxID=36842 RepID=A0A1T5M9G6_9FIRM|nr:dihydroxyacetone kinase subunit DhaK [Maledivibacter halophilus]SKC84876.1 dihydroxyacetone kinase DhaK subunit [Maledivibacter halophilus]